MTEDEEIRTAEIIRALIITSDSWENDILSVDDMCDQLDALCDVFEGKMNFIEFSQCTNLVGRERLN